MSNTIKAAIITGVATMAATIIDKVVNTPILYTKLNMLLI